MARLSIALFGPLCVTRDGEPLGGIYSDKVRALLAYLAVESGRPHRRETLAGLLWPESPERSARHSLSQALHNLRRALELDECGSDAMPCLVATPQSISLSAAPGCVDAVAFLALLEACETHDHPSLISCSACRERLQQAVALYRGDLLAGFSLQDSPAFEEWLLLQRERFRRQAVDALRALASPGASGDGSAPLDAARQWVTLEPLDDEARRGLMRALAGGGHRGAALVQFERFVDTLADELGVDPERATVALAEHIRDGALSLGGEEGASDAGLAAGALLAEPRAPPAFLSSPERYLPPLFVARERELAQLDGHLQTVLAGQPRVVFVTGEPGSGKTALLRAFQQGALAADGEMVTATGHCNAHTGLGDPYLAFREILAQLTGEVESAWAAGAISGEQARRLWGLAPETAQALAEAGPDLVGTLVSVGPLLERARAAGPVPWLGTLERLASDWQTRRVEQLRQAALFSQVTAVLQRLACRHPLVLVLEDLHWSDAGTVALLFHLGCHLANDRVLIVCSYRPAEVLAAAVDHASGNARHPLVPVVHEFARRFGEIEVDLNRADGQRFVDALIDSEPNALGSAFRTTLLRQCDGNALFTVEVLRDLQERGRLVRDARGHWVEAALQDSASLPARVEGVLAERIGRLPPPLQEALRVASVEGETFSVEVLAHVLGRESPGVVRWLSGDLSRTHHLVSPLEGPLAGTATLGRYRFRHILFQNYVYGTLDAIECAYLHRAVAEAIEATAHEDGDDHVLALARHYEEAGDADKASNYLQRAGDRAMRLVAFAEAEELYTRGLELLASVPQGRDRDAAEIDLLLRLAGARGISAGFADPRLADIARRALSLGERLQDDLSSYRALSVLLNYHIEAGAYEAATTEGETLQALARSLEDEDLAAWARNWCAWMWLFRGHFASAVRDVEPILALWKRGDLDALRARLNQRRPFVSRSLVTIVMALAPMGHYTRALGYLSEALELGRASAPGIDECFVAGLAAFFYCETRDYEKALRWALEYCALAERGGFATWSQVGRAYECWARAQMGEAHEVLQLARDLLARAEAQRYGSHLPGYLRVLADCCVAAGRPQEALATASRGLTLCAEHGYGQHLVPLHLARAQALLLLDPPDAIGAEAAFNDALAVARRQEAHLFELRAAVALGRLWSSQGRTDEARALVQPVYDWFTEGFDLPDLVEARELLAEVGS